MRILVSTVLLLLSAGVYAFGDTNCQGLGNCNEYEDNSITNKAYGGDGGYAKAYGGDGGDANVGNGIGNFSPKSQADAYAKQLQLQGNVGLGSGNATTVQIQSKSKIEAEPAIAPSIAPGDPTAPCYVTLGGSAAGGGIASFGFSGYKYDTICGAMEFYRVVGNDPTHKKQASKAVNVAYHNLMNRMWDEMGETEYNKATGDVVEDSGTTASHTYPTQDGGFMKVSFTKLGAAGVDGEEVTDIRSGPDN
jgi:hypothetical protein